VKSTGERIKGSKEYLEQGLKGLKSAGKRIKCCEEYWRKD